MTQEYLTGLAIGMMLVAVYFAFSARRWRRRYEDRVAGGSKTTQAWGDLAPRHVSEKPSQTTSK